MKRSRFNFPRGDRDRDRQDNGEKGQIQKVFRKLQELRPSLKSRLNKIRADNREREFEEEINEINGYLSVMDDVHAYRNHSATELQGFIDKVHEMVRQSSAPSNDQEESDKEEGELTPETPSPEIDWEVEEVGGNPQNGEETPGSSTASTILMANSFGGLPQDGEGSRCSSPPSTVLIVNSFGGPPTATKKIRLGRSTTDFVQESIKGDIINQRKAPSTHRNSWDLQNDSFNTLGPSQDVEGRNALKPLLDTTPLGQGELRPSQWQDSYQSPSVKVEAAAPPRKRYASNWSSDREWQHYGHRQDYNHCDRDRQYEKNSFPAATGPQLQRPEENFLSMFERRPQPQFEMRERVSNTFPDGSVRIDYNHGEEQVRNDRGPTSSVTDWDRNIRYQSPTSNPGFYPQNNMHIYENQNLQMYNRDTYIQNPSSLTRQQTTAVNRPGITFTLGLNSGIPHVHRFPHQPLSLPHPGVQPGFLFPRHAAPVPLNYLQVAVPPQQCSKKTLVDFYPSASATPEIDRQLKEKLWQQAVQNLSEQRIPRNDSHISYNPAAPQKTLPPEKSPETGLLASTHGLSDDDPILLWLNQISHEESSISQNESSAPNARSKDSDRRVELDPTLVRREWEPRTDSDSRYRHDYSRHQKYHRKDKPREDGGKMSLKKSGKRRDRVDRADKYSHSRDSGYTRNRVKERISTHRHKPASKLQKIQKPVEPDRFHAYARPSSTKVSTCKPRASRNDYDSTPKPGRNEKSQKVPSDTNTSKPLPRFRAKLDALLARSSSTKNEEPHHPPFTPRSPSASPPLHPLPTTPLPETPPPS